MQPRPPKPWFLLTNLLVVLCAGWWLMSDLSGQGWAAFPAWELLIVWLLCLVLSIYAYGKKWAFHRRHQGTSPTEEEPAP